MSINLKQTAKKRGDPFRSLPCMISEIIFLSEQTVLVRSGARAVVMAVGAVG